VLYGYVMNIVVNVVVVVDINLDNIFDVNTVVMFDQ